MIKKLALALAGMFALLIGYVAAQPSDYKVSRDIIINAPAEKIFPHLNNSRLADQWGPWAEVDPEVKMDYSGPDAGVGSKASWDSPGRLGTGSATIVESIPNQRVVTKLEYTKPMAMTQDATYLLEAVGAQTKMTWFVTGKNTFMGRFMCLFMNMDKTVGAMFEKGLSNLKTLVESERGQS